MKKIVALLLALVLSVSLCSAVFAAEVTADNQSETTDVTANYIAGEQGPYIVYSVDVTWTDMSFTYNGPSSQIWNPETHKYEGDNSTGGWEVSDEKITVANSSNVSIHVLPEYTAEAGYDAAQMTFDTDKLYLDSAVASGAAVEGVIEVDPDGVLKEGTAANTKIGTITVTIRKAFVDSQSVVSELFALRDKLIADNGVEQANIDLSDEEIAALPAGTKYISSNDVMALTAKTNVFYDRDFDEDYSQLYGYYVDAVEHIYGMIKIKA